MPDTPSPAPHPERAVIGFFLYVTSIFAFGRPSIDLTVLRRFNVHIGIYVLWAYLPNDWFEKIGVTYYPHK